MSTEPLIEQFVPLSALAGLGHGFVLRQPDVDVATTDKDEAVAALRPAHERVAESLGFLRTAIACGEQIHAAGVALAEAGDGLGAPLPGIDGFVTATPGLLLGVHVADCCAVYLADRRGRAVGLVHSGRKGTELGIAVRAIESLGELGVPPGDLVIQLSPCIRPPRYEVDIAAQIQADCQAAGVPRDQIHDDGVCTGGDLGRYYSYRVEKGRTGRMLALLGIREP